MEFWTLMLTPHWHAFDLMTSLLALSAMAVGIVAGAGGDAGGEPAGGGAPDAGAGGGAADDAVDPADAGADRREAGAGGGADDELDEDEVDLPPEVRDDPKRIRTRLRRLQRQHTTVARIAERFRGPDGRYLQPEEIDRIRGRAADMEEIQALLDEHPDLTEQLLERRRGGGRAAAADPEWQDPYAAMLDKLPFDPEHPSSQWFLNEFRSIRKENHELRQALKKVEHGVGTVQQRDQQRTEQQVEGTWKNQTLTVGTSRARRDDGAGCSARARPRSASASSSAASAPTSRRGTPCSRTTTRTPGSSTP
jgi:hypothetical protein